MFQNRANQDIRKFASEKGFKLWEIAEYLGISEGTFCRHLRKEMPSDQKDHVIRMIERMAEYRDSKR